MDSFQRSKLYVKVGETLHKVAIEFPVPEKQGHVVVQQYINNKKQQLTSSMLPLCSIGERGLIEPQHFLQVKCNHSNLPRLLQKNTPTNPSNKTQPFKSTKISSKKKQILQNILRP